MFHLTGVSKTFGNHTALYPTDLDLESGHVHVLIGPSGCGKTTLLRLMLLLAEPDTGTVTFDGEVVDSHTALATRQRIGYVVQQGGLFPHLSVRDNVSLVARYLKWDKERIGGRLAELAELAHLPAELMDRYPAQLSGGQQQRVGLMRALMLNPDALLMDEPLGALDPMIRAELQRDLREVFRELDKTVVMVTHDLAEAAFFADTITLLRDGRIVQRGSFQDLVDKPADDFVKQFVSAQQSHWLDN